MTRGFARSSPYPQPSEKYFPTQILHGLDEEVDYLPGTHIRVWFTYLPTAYPIHRHACMEIVEGVHSYYTITSGGRTWRVEPGDVLITPPGCLHDLIPGPECNGWIYLFDISWMQAIPSAHWLPELTEKPVFLSHERQNSLYMNTVSHLTQMRNMYFSSSGERELLFDAEALLLMSQLHTGLTSPEAEESLLDKRHIHGALFGEVMDYIEQNYTRNLTLAEISQHFNLSSAYFSRLFAQYARESFSDYLAHRRLKEAERLLVDDALSMTEVALRCGYSSASVFSRAFLAHRKCSPSQFRRIYSQLLRAGDAAQLSRAQSASRS